MSDCIVDAFRLQSGWCRQLGSPFTADLLGRAAEDIAQGGPVAALLGDWPGYPVADALALRFAGALHAAVLASPDSPIGRCYPPSGSAGDSDPLWAAITALLRDDHQVIARFLERPPQTNEVRRSAMLLGGFLEIARRTRLPMRLVEIGASAGLNQLWDRYHYRLGDTAVWGPDGAGVTIATDWSGPPPPLDAPVMISSRTACDATPFDLDDPAERLRLRCYVWADQIERLALLDPAIAAARAAHIRVVREDAGDFVAREFRQAVTGQVSVLYHSVMWQYMPPETQSRIRQTLKAAAAATATAPIAWLRMEPDSDGAFNLQLTLWPDGSTASLGTCHPHGAWMRWAGTTLA